MKRPLLFEIFIPVCLLLPGFTDAQSMELEVIGAAGTSLATSAGTLQYTVGEPMIRTVAQEGILSEGFHQAAVWEIVPVQEIPEINLSVWPNPFPEYLEIKTDRPVSLTLYDVIGKKVMSPVEVQDRILLQPGQLPAGAYFLEVSDANGRPLGLYKLIHAER